MIVATALRPAGVGDGVVRAQRVAANTAAIPATTMPASAPRASSAGSTRNPGCGSARRIDPSGNPGLTATARPDTGDGAGEDRREHRGQGGDDPLPAAEADGFQHDRIARTPLEVPRHRLGHHDRAGGGGDGGEQEQRVALQRRRALDRLDVDLLVRGVAEGADVDRQVGGERVPVDAVGHVQRQDRARLVGTLPATAGERRSGEDDELATRVVDEVLAQADDADDDGVSDALRLALHALQRRQRNAVPDVDPLTQCAALAEQDLVGAPLLGVAAADEERPPVPAERIVLTDDRVGLGTGHARTDLGDRADDDALDTRIGGDLVDELGRRLPTDEHDDLGQIGRLGEAVRRRAGPRRAGRQRQHAPGDDGDEHADDDQRAPTVADLRPRPEPHPGHHSLRSMSIGRSRAAR